MYIWNYLQNKNMSFSRQQCEENVKNCNNEMEHENEKWNIFSNLDILCIKNTSSSLADSKSLTL